MTTSDWSLIEQYFHQALEQPDAQRKDWLDGQLSDRPDVRDAVLRLLSHAESTRSLESIVEHAAHQTLDATQDYSGSMAGPYKLIKRLEDGGMGSVYLAERADEHYQKRVAVKLIRTSLANDYLYQRFKEERQTLANLEHANITQLYDGGETDAGIPFLVMEFVEGVPIDVYCQSQNLSTNDRLRLFAKVCKAIQFAHQKLVVHCDLKPANILVNEQGEPKLMDFGIARLLDKSGSQQSPDKHLTLQYASPEQLAGDDVTVAADIFALGLVLHQILLGRLPDAPHQKPDTAASDLSTLQKHSACADAGIVRGIELDSMLAKALEQDPANRYASANALANDIERYIGQYPVLARSAPWTFRANLFLRRNALATSLSIALNALIIGSSVTIWLQSKQVEEQRQLAEQQRDIAITEQQKAEQVTQFITDMFKSVDPDNTAGREISVMEVVEATIRQLDTAQDQALAEQPLVEAKIRYTLGNILWVLGKVPAAIDQLEVAKNIYQQYPDQYLAEYLKTLNALSNAYSRADRQQERLAILEYIVDTATKLHGENARLTIGYTLNLGGYYNNIEQPQKAIEIHLDTLARARAHLGEESDVVIINLASLGNDYLRFGDLQASIDYFEQALTLSRKVMGDKKYMSLYTMERLITVYQEERLFEKSQPLAEEYLTLVEQVYGNKHLDTHRARYLVASGLIRDDQYQKALDMMQMSLDILPGEVGLQHYQVMDIMSHKATALMGLARYDDAEVTLHELIPLMNQRHGEAHNYPLKEKTKLAEIHKRRGDYALAIDTYQKTLQGWSQHELAVPSDYQHRFAAEFAIHLALAEISRVQNDTKAMQKHLQQAAKIKATYTEVEFSDIPESLLDAYQQTQQDV